MERDFSRDRHQQLHQWGLRPGPRQSPEVASAHQGTHRGCWRPGAQGSRPQHRNRDCCWHRNRGLLDLKVFSGLDEKDINADPDAQKIQGPSLVFPAPRHPLRFPCDPKEGARAPFGLKQHFLPAQWLTDLDSDLNRNKENKNNLC